MSETANIHDLHAADSSGIGAETNPSNPPNPLPGPSPAFEVFELAPLFLRDEAWAWLEPVLRANISREEKLDRRDEEIRAARRLYDPTRERRAAEGLASDLKHYAATAWLEDRARAWLPGQTERKQALHTILRLNDGEPLAWRQVLNIWRGRRGGN